jgi:hypothetical protein
MQSRIYFAICAVVLLCLSSTKYSFSQSSARTLPRSLNELIAESDTIIHGFVLSSKIEPHPQLRNLMTVVVEISVKDTYKGKKKGALVFRQYVWNVKGGKSAEYHVGEELVLLLRPVSKSGLTSPSGLEQGLFHVIPDRSRRLTAVNGRANIGIFDHLEPDARTRGIPVSAHLATLIHNHHRGPVLLADLEEAIRTFARSR